MALFRTSCSVIAMAAGLLLASCSSARLDPDEYDYYSTSASSPSAGASDGTDYSAVPSRGTPAPSSYTPAPAIDPVPIDPTPVDPVVPAASTVHVLRKGETVYRLSERYLGSAKRWREIADLNGLSDAEVHRLPVGRKIKIPSR